MIPYFDSVDAYLDIGPPVYFVVHDVDVTQRPGQQKLCGRFTTCEPLSIASTLELERGRPDVSYISQPAASWIDDYFNWLDPNKDKCCRVRNNDPTTFCRSGESPRRCHVCYKDHEPAWNITMRGLPEGDEFMMYLKQWLASPTNEDCPIAGEASFGNALALSADGTEVVASHFRTFHRPLKSQADFINSFAAAQRVANDLAAATGARVFPYSLHYVFFDQFAHIIPITEPILGLGLAAVLLVTALLLGSWRTGTIVTSVVALTVVNVMGVMGVWGIDLNAISLVNLVISLGIAVEFCAHVARAFMSAGSGLPVDHPAGQKERDERMWLALVDVGPSVRLSRTSSLCGVVTDRRQCTGALRHHVHETYRDVRSRIDTLEVPGGVYKLSERSETELMQSLPDLLFPHVDHPHHLRRTAWLGPASRRPQSCGWLWVPTAGGRRRVDVSRHSERLRIHVSVYLHTVLGSMTERAFVHTGLS